VTGWTNKLRGDANDQQSRALSSLSKAQVRSALASPPIEKHTHKTTDCTMKLAFSLLFSIAAVFLLLPASAEPDIFDEDEILPSSSFLNEDMREASSATMDAWVENEIWRRHIIPDQFIVVFDGKRVANATETGLRLIGAHGNENTQLLWSYHAAFRGVTMSGVSHNMLIAMTEDPDVDYCEPVSLYFC